METKSKRLRYTCKAPVQITPRLELGLKLQAPSGTSWLSITYGGWTDDKRRLYKVHLDMPNGRARRIYGMASAVGGGTLYKGLCDILCFLGAAVDTYKLRGDFPNSDVEMFGADIVRWAARNEHELSYLLAELEEVKDAIIEEVA